MKVSHKLVAWRCCPHTVLLIGPELPEQDSSMGGDSAGNTSPRPASPGAEASRCAEVLIGPAGAVLDTVAAQRPGHAGAVLVEHGAAAPPR